MCYVFNFDDRHNALKILDFLTVSMNLSKGPRLCNECGTDEKQRDELQETMKQVMCLIKVVLLTVFRSL